MDKIAVLDFGGQYAHLIANRIRRLGVYSEILDPETPLKNLLAFKGIILSGGPASVHAPESIKCDAGIYDSGIPILGICYGHQLTASLLGGEIKEGSVREYGSANISFDSKDGIFQGVENNENVWMSHFDQVDNLPEGFKIMGHTEDCPIAAMADLDRKIFSMQFHPEVTHTPCGMTILENFVEITNAKREWNIDNYIEDIGKEIKEKVGDKKVFLMISGGVDSTVAYLLLAKTLGPERIYGLFVDIGFMRMNEREEVEAALKNVGVENLHVYDAGEEYFKALENVYEPEEKRKIIGDLFLDIQAKVSDELNLNPEEWFLAQGTIYPDTIETGGTKHADKIKTHHNQVERILKLKKEGKVLEPLDQLYKDEVRLVGERLGLAEKMVWRHPFPGPGLAVRTLCLESEDYPAKHLELESKMNQAIEKTGAKVKILPIKSVGVQGDERTYKHPAVIYGAELSWEELDNLSTQMTNQYPEVNRVIFGLNNSVYTQLVIQKNYLKKERILTIQKADKIVMDYLDEVNISREIWQFPTVLIPLSVDGKNTESIVLRPVCSQEAMTANFYRMNFDHLKELTKRLEALDGISGIFYDLTNKPPGTIEWE